MKAVKYAPIAIALSAVSFAGLAQSITATGSTLDDAETHIAQQALTTKLPKAIQVIRYT